MVKNKLCAIVNLTENEDQLKPLTHLRPIAALPFAGRYRVVDFSLSSIAHAEIDSCALFISESGRAVYDHIRSGDSWNFDSQISGGIFTFSQQTWKLRHLREHGGDDFYDNHRIFMKRANAEYVFVSGSKMITNVDIRAVYKHHIDSEADITTVYKPVILDKVRDYTVDMNLKLDEYGQLVDVVPLKEASVGEKVNVNLNMYILSVDKMNEIMQRAEAEGNYQEVDSLIEKYLLDYTVNVYEYTGYSANVETMDRFYQANMDMLDRSKFNSLFYTSQPILTKTKNGVPSYYDNDSKVTESIIGTGVRIDGEVTRSVINRKVYVHKDAVVKESVIFQGTTIGEGAQVEYAIVDKACSIKPGAKVIGTPDNIKVIGKNTVVEA
ncbi:glucose-1-phosphate adenylyltransferase subunit GlgD [Globicatella sp. HMSC072A10]|uniref:glucose-1-phosphate adenylyltransferase subunit GlgD n=1 Tax=Globicatella sp. HMSC072A10 TaxID=1739315 RepID=UPI0008BDA81D|nr:glucose-1-phosphate adenylyltransferase subunit GlgD [Globicatella sp. HMSC072A10]OFK54937.1 glucose-1-phosphate adenylyltransferase subunit GlgD [Globicatella sp. HMSC072A10]